MDLGPLGVVLHGALSPAVRMTACFQSSSVTAEGNTTWTFSPSPTSRVFQQLDGSATRNAPNHSADFRTFIASSSAGLEEKTLSAGRSPPGRFLTSSKSDGWDRPWNLFGNPPPGPAGLRQQLGSSIMAGSAAGVSTGRRNAMAIFIAQSKGKPSGTDFPSPINLFEPARCDRFQRIRGFGRRICPRPTAGLPWLSIPNQQRRCHRSCLPYTRWDFLFTQACDRTELLVEEPCLPLGPRTGVARRFDIDQSLIRRRVRKNIDLHIVAALVPVLRVLAYGANEVPRVLVRLRDQCLQKVHVCDQL